jgi:hypothetical protein
LFSEDELLISSAKKIAARVGSSWQQRANYWPEISKPGRARLRYCGASFHDREGAGMPKENNGPTFEGLNAPTLFREFAAECMQLAQTTPVPEKRAMYLRMASVWHQMAQRWEKKR